MFYKLSIVFRRLEIWIEANGWNVYDPDDLRETRFYRIFSNQALGRRLNATIEKYAPSIFRKLLFIILIINPKAIALFAQAYLASYVGTAAILQIGLNILIIPHFGMMWAALNTAISYLVMLLMSAIISKRLVTVHYEYKRLWLMSMTALIIFLVSRQIQIENIYISFILRGILAASFPLVLGLVGFFHPYEKRRLMENLRSIYGRIIRYIHRKQLENQCKEDIGQCASV